MPETKLMYGLEDKRVLVTGASGGIGAAIAARFAEMGAIVGVHYHTRDDAAAATVAAAVAAGGTAAAFGADLTSVAACRQLLQSFVTHFGRIDVLVNNAGAAVGYKHFSSLPQSDWDATFDLNARAPFYLSSEAFELMREQGGGRIVNISSTSVKYGGSAKGMHYAAAKAALESLTVGFSRAGAPHNILVNAIRCGVIDTDMHKRIEGYDGDRFRERVAMIPLGRVGTPAEVASLVTFLAGDTGSFITGEMIAVAGGD